MIKLLIAVHDRPEYLKRSLDSLMESFDTIYPEINIIDDGSVKPETQVILNDLLKKDYPGEIEIIKWDHIGLPFCKLKPLKFVMSLKNKGKYLYDEPFILVTDADMIYKKGWVETLVDIYEETGAPLVTGFNTLTNKHDTLEEFDTYVRKASVGGCNLLIDSDFYRSHPFDEPREWDYRMCERAHDSHPMGVLASKPSVVDHIGVKGHWARANYHDKAIDFKEEETK